jgi:hypothetical protein
MIAPLRFSVVSLVIRSNAPASKIAPASPILFPERQTDRLWQATFARNRDANSQIVQQADCRRTSEVTATCIKAPHCQPMSLSIDPDRHTAEVPVSGQQRSIALPQTREDFSAWLCEGTHTCHACAHACLCTRTRDERRRRRTRTHTRAHNPVERKPSVAGSSNACAHTCARHTHACAPTHTCARAHTLTRARERTPARPCTLKPLTRPLPVATS